MNKKLLKMSFIINILIFLMVLFACIVMFTGIKFMHGRDLVLESTSIGMFRFFTVDSNILMGIVAIIFAYQELRVIKNKQKDINIKYYLLELMGTGAVTLTFLVTFLYLSRVSKYGLAVLLMNSNLFFHLIVPVVSIINFVLLLRTNKIKLRDVIWGILPTFLYGIYYLTNILLHMEKGKVSPIYDFYYFVQGGVKTAIIVVPIIFLISYLICLILWRLNKKTV